ncbi:polysaccharide deacetylase family protein [Natronolimnohabitans innermongolicus]|uniref:Polysaccharide deacetylase n=1 Tax=Natronolimnohabitans innermongolicus JCM 12255 TaxID=1227499 RepID=L9XKA1_9EURY|nr:polysaccharide deacetylase family protein [Natronolimnohabitans innermongolicus]ELY61861.1 polysaccharide deacetylase [Natronolimnohabitans innermongolicus JCM 12255]
MDRRRYLATGLAVTLAGCMGLSGQEDTDTQDESNGTESDDSDDSDADTETTDTDHDLVGTFDDFEDLDLWFAHEDYGSVEADTDRSSEGSQSAVLDPEDDGQVRMRRSLDEPIDVEDVVPGIAMTGETGSTILIQLQDENGDYAEFSQRVVENGPLTRHNFGLTRIRGDPDLSEVIVLQVVYWAEDARLWVDDFYFTPRPERPGKVMLQFHGGHETHYTQGFSTLEEHGLTGAAFVPTNRIGPDAAAAGDYLTEDQIGDLADAGWTIGSYSAQGSQLSDVDAPGDDLEDNITGPIEWLEGEGYEDGARCFAYPGATYTETAYEIVQENYDIAFAGGAPAQGYAGNPHLCSITNSPDPGDGPELLEWTAEYGGITAIPFYQLEEDDAIEALQETAERLADLESEGELEVISPVDMADQYVL